MPDNTITWRGATPVSNVFGDIYYSVENGLEESRAVFLKQSNLPNAWESFTAPEFTVLETGFGTGLNFCACGELWLQHRQPNQRLHYISIEKYPLSVGQIQQALNNWPELKPIADQLCSLLPPRVNGWHKLEFAELGICLTLVYADVQTALEQIEDNNLRANTIFLDGFTPARNPDMWSNEVLGGLAKCAATGASLATFTAVSAVRRGLEAVGFAMSINKGFGYKRNMLAGVFKHTATTSTPRWYKTPATKTPQTIAVIGSGISGSLIAHKLATHGKQVTVFEQAPSIASGASGNPQGILFLRLSASNGGLADYALQAYIYAMRFYGQLVDDGIATPAAVSNHGMLQLLNSDDWSALKTKYQGLTEFIQFVDAKTASGIAGTTVNQPAFYLPSGGWVNPSLLCEQLLTHQNIELHCSTPVDKLEQVDSEWRLAAGGSSFDADAVVLANSLNCQQFLPNYKLPLKPAPGQITNFPADAQLNNLNCAICHEGYIAPPQDGLVSIGATFRMKTAGTALTEQDHQTNLERYNNAFPNLPTPKNHTGRVATRCATADYLPIAGPVPNANQLISDFAMLDHNAKADIQKYGNTVNNLYVLTGMGSRGFTYAPLAAEVVTQSILGASTTISPHTIQTLHPARFLIRGLKRGTVNALLQTH